MLNINAINLFITLIFVACHSFCSEKEQIVYKSHGLARFDDLKYPADFKHLDYVNPNAPKGGQLKTIGIGSCDSLNPYAKNGTSLLDIPPMNYMFLGFLGLNEPLMAGSGQYAPMADEPRSAYGLIAESIEYPEDNHWIIFNLRQEARFHDGHPITARDVLFSYQQLKDNGPIKYQQALQPIKGVEVLDKHRVRFNFLHPGQRGQLFSAAELPVLPAHYWESRDISKSTLALPLNSGPYKVTQFEPGRSLTFTRVANYWGKNLPVNTGKYNIDTLTIYFYNDLTVAFEAFKSGAHDLHFEPAAKNWATAYNFPAIKKGHIQKSEVSTQIVPGNPMIILNSRRKPFDDSRVREALGYLLDFEWTNRTIFYNAYHRATSYFPGSVYAATGKPSQDELALLTPWHQNLPPRLFSEPFSPPKTAGDGNLRENKNKALQLLKTAGWRLKDKTLINKEGTSFSFEIISFTHLADRLIIPYKKNLESMGITMNYRVLDSSSYFQRIKNHDFDAIGNMQSFGLSIGGEIARHFHSKYANTPNSQNLAGIQNPVIDSLLDKLSSVKSQHELETVVRSLDRVLLWNHYGIPLFYSNVFRIAYRNIYQWPETKTALPMFINTWWVKPESYGL